MLHFSFALSLVKGGQLVRYKTNKWISGFLKTWGAVSVGGRFLRMFGLSTELVTKGKLATVK